MIMPQIDLGTLWRKLSVKDMAIVRRIVDQKTWCLKGARPRLHESAESRYAAYVWRMVAFQISPNAQHHHMPTTCFWWLPKGTNKSIIQWLDGLVSKITDTVPKEEWWGVLAWSGLASSEDVDMKKFLYKATSNNVKEYMEDSEIRAKAIKEKTNV